MVTGTALMTSRTFMENLSSCPVPSATHWLDHQHRALRVVDDALRNTPEDQPFDCAKAASSDHDQVDAGLVGGGDDLLACRPEGDGSVDGRDLALQRLLRLRQDAVKFFGAIPRHLVEFCQEWREVVVSGHVSCRLNDAE